MEPRARGAAPRGRKQQPIEPAVGRRRHRRTVGQQRSWWEPGRGRQSVGAERGAGRAGAALHRTTGVENPPRQDGANAPCGGAWSEGLVTTLALWVLVALQAMPPPDVTARVDRTHVAVGEDLTLTIRARTRSTDPIGVVLPGLTGFTIVGSREVSEVTIEGVGGPVRTTTRELQLRAGRPGTLVIGPVRVHQGSREVTTTPVTVTVDSAAAALGPGFSPSARRLVEAAAEPARNDRVAVNVILPGDSVLVGQQLDVIAAAWFPRELRVRLRQAPILTLQTREGVWSYPGAAPSEVAVSRLVRGRWLDVFVAHQAVFPLAPGRIVIPPALVEYAVPATFSFFSREDRFSLRSDTVPVAVLPLPARGGRTDDQRVVAQGLGLDLGMDPASGRVGEPMAMTATVSGVGNVALWPEPVIRWPPAFRAYAGETGMRLEPRDGRIAGTKVFHYLVMPDSAGSFVLPEVRYPYYDLVAGDYRVATIAPRSLAVAPGVEPRAARALPPLASGDASTWTEALAYGLVPWGWLALLVGPPVLAWLWLRREQREPPAELPAPIRLTRLGQLEREFHAVLASQVPDPQARDGDGLARALRATGLESAVAGHVLRLRDRLRASRYGPRGQGDAAELAAGLEQVLHVLGAEPGRTRRRASVVALVALVAVLLWLAVWLAVAARRRRTVVLGLAVLTAVATTLAAREGLRRARPLAIVLNAATPVRTAPYGSASAASTVEAGAALLIVRSYGPWLEVRRADGIRGWVLSTEVARL